MQETAKKELILVGGGGHCRSCIEVVESGTVYTIKGVLDLYTISSNALLGYPFLGGDDRFADYIKEGHHFLISVGQIKTSKVRRRLYGELESAGGILARVISPWSRVSAHAHIGQGTIVMHGAVVNAGAVVGDNCIINTQAVVEHDAVIGSHTHISTGAIVNGGACVGKHSFIGSRAMIREGVSIGDSSVIGAGACIFKAVAKGVLVKGQVN